MNDVDELRKLLTKATPGPWVWEQCGDKCDDPVIGVAYGPDDLDCTQPLSGKLEDAGDDYYRERIAYNIEGGAGVDASSNAALIVAAVNALPSLLDRLEVLTAKNERLREALEQAPNMVLGLIGTIKFLNNGPDALKEETFPIMETARQWAIEICSYINKLGDG